MGVILLFIYTIAYFVGNLVAAGLNKLLKRVALPRRTAGLALVSITCAFYLYITAEAFFQLDTSRLSNFDQGRIAGEVFGNVLLPFGVVLVAVAFAARREKRKLLEGREASGAGPFSSD